MDCYWIYGYILLLATLTLISEVTGCPAACKCVLTEARCEQVGLYNIPSGIPQGTTTLDLKNNKITDLQERSFILLPNLVNLQLANNLLAQIHNLAFRNLTHLQTLDLSGNQLIAVNFETFRGTPNLIHLNLSNNKLYYIHSAFFGLKHLTRLDLSSNELTEITGRDLKDLESVQELYLNHNLISTLHPQAFAGLKDILTLDINHNPLGAVGRLNFTCESLTFIDMSECNLTRIPRYFPSSVNYLQLQRNNLTVIKRDDFRHMIHLSRLILDENQITRIDKYAFYGATKLQELWLNRNQLKKIPLKLPSSVQTLLLQSNLIAKIATWTFDKGNKLKQLSLMDNQILYIDWNAFHPLRKLDQLDLSNNKLEMVTTNVFLGLKNLKLLNLAKNPIQYFYPHCFQGLTDLKTLNLAYIRLDHALIADNSCTDLINIKKLTIDSSQGIAQTLFHSKVLLSQFKSVTELSMQSTELKTMPHYFLSYLPQLQTFHISSSRWHCDSRMIWFKNWLLNTTVRVVRAQTLTCITPFTLFGKPMMDLKDSDFVPASTAETTVRRESPTFPKLPPTTNIPKPTDAFSWRPYTTRKPTPPSTPMKDEHPSHDSRYESPVTSESPKLVITIPAHKLGQRPDREAEPGEGSDDGMPYSKTTIIIVAVSVTVTVIVFILVIVIIVMMKRKDKHKDEYKNAVKYKHKNNVLYFMPKSEGAVSHDGTLMSTSSSKDGSIALVPGRDITQEGPLRVYKWEDF